MVNKKLLDEMVDKWWIILGDHIVTNEEIEQFCNDANTLGITHIDLMDKIIEKYGGGIIND